MATSVWYWGGITSGLTYLHDQCQLKLEWPIVWQITALICIKFIKFSNKKIQRAITPTGVILEMSNWLEYVSKTRPYILSILVPAWNSTCRVNKILCYTFTICGWFSKKWRFWGTFFVKNKSCQIIFLTVWHDIGM